MAHYDLAPAFPEVNKVMQHYRDKIRILDVENVVNMKQCGPLDTFQSLA